MTLKMMDFFIPMCFLMIVNCALNTAFVFIFIAYRVLEKHRCRSSDITMTLGKVKISIGLQWEFTIIWGLLLVSM